MNVIKQTVGAVMCMILIVAVLTPVTVGLVEGGNGTVDADVNSDEGYWYRTLTTDATLTMDATQGKVTVTWPDCEVTLTPNPTIPVAISDGSITVVEYSDEYGEMIITNGFAEIYTEDRMEISIMVENEEWIGKWIVDGEEQSITLGPVDGVRLISPKEQSEYYGGRNVTTTGDAEMHYLLTNGEMVAGSLVKNIPYGDMGGDISITSFGQLDYFPEGFDQFAESLDIKIAVTPDGQMRSLEISPDSAFGLHSTTAYVTVSEYTTFFITTDDGALYGMGANGNGQQGNGTTTDVLTPTRIGEGLGEIVKVVATKQSTFFKTIDGELYGMGDNSYGQQGNGTTTDVLTPTRIGEGLGTISQVVATDTQTFFITTDGALYGMGQNDTFQIDTTGNTKYEPTRIGEGLGVITKVLSNTSATFFITGTGALYGMGENVNRMMGGTSDFVREPTQIGADLGRINDVDAGFGVMYFKTTAGKLYGMGGTTLRNTPIQIGTSLGNVSMMDAGWYVMFFKTTTGELYGMDSNLTGNPMQVASGNVGSFVTYPGGVCYIAGGSLFKSELNGTATQIGADLGTVADMSSTTTQTFFVTDDGTLYGMGGNSYGQQGNGTTTDVASPEAVDVPQTMIYTNGMLMLADKSSETTAPVEHANIITLIPLFMAVTLVGGIVTTLAFRRD